MHNFIDKIKHVFLRIKTYKNWYTLVWPMTRILPKARIIYTRTGCKIFVRDVRGDDYAVVHEMFVRDDYKIKSIQADKPVVLDFGANIGVFSVAMARRFPGAKVISFEPEKSNYEILEKNAKLNPGVIPVRKAISNQTGEQEFFSSLHKYSSSLIREHMVESTFSEKVSRVTIGDILNEYNLDKIDIIKMDIEGGEIKALRGMNDTIKKNQVVLITEYAPFYFEDPTELIRIIEEVGFKTIYNLFDNGKVELFDYNNINRYIPEGKNITSNTNLVCTK